MAERADEWRASAAVGNTFDNEQTWQRRITT